jgi:transcriptional regulator with XRE-family HTH domain
MSYARRRLPQTAAASDQLRMVIAARRLTPTAVAKAADVAPSMITRFLNGQRGLTLDTFDRVAAALGLRLVEGPRRGGRSQAEAPGRPRPAASRSAAGPDGPAPDDDARGACDPALSVTGPGEVTEIEPARSDAGAEIPDVPGRPPAVAASGG